MEDKFVKLSFILRDNDFISFFVNDENYKYHLCSYNLMNENHLLLFKMLINNLGSKDFKNELDNLKDIIVNYEKRIKECL